MMNDFNSTTYGRSRPDPILPQAKFEDRRKVFCTGMLFPFSDASQRIFFLGLMKLRSPVLDTGGNLAKLTLINIGGDRSR